MKVSRAGKNLFPKIILFTRVGVTVEITHHSKSLSIHPTQMHRYTYAHPGLDDVINMRGGTTQHTAGEKAVDFTPAEANWGRFAPMRRATPGGLDGRSIRGVAVPRNTAGDARPGEAAWGLAARGKRQPLNLARGRPSKKQQNKTVSQIYDPPRKMRSSGGGENPPLQFTQILTFGVK